VAPGIAILTALVSYMRIERQLLRWLRRVSRGGRGRNRHEAKTVLEFQ
jgi:hypothetical protein